MSRSRHEEGSSSGALSRLKSAQGWIALFSLVVVVLIALVDVERTSPGPLAAVHGSIEELDDGASCSSCHGGLFSGMTASCLECHELISEQMDAGEGLHGTFDEEAAARCALCHSEHHGSSFALVNKQSFARAGIDDPESFDHELVGFEMSGRHLEITCAECHVNAEAAVLPPGEHRFIGLDPSCVRCHDDPHNGRMVRACVECHSQAKFDDLHALGHETHLELIGAHRGLDCRTCHAEEEEHSLEELARGLRGREARNCSDCHESPHDERFLKRVGRFVKDDPGASCAACHVAEHTIFNADGAPEELDSDGGAQAESTVGAVRVPRFLKDQVTPRLHKASGFPLVAPHDALSCSVCHDPNKTDFERRHPGRSADACSVCHEDPHGGQFEQGQFAGRECTACHAQEHFLPHAFDAEAHGQTNFALEGTHETADCASCHLEPPGQPRLFTSTPSRCEDCHEDAHGGFFDATLATLAQQREEGTCSECHLSTTFDDVMLAAAASEEGGGEAPGFAGRPFEHGSWTGFAVRGAHAQGSCESCHPRSELPDDHGRKFGRVEEHFGNYESCATCHEDPHEGRFDDRAVPARHMGQTGCLRCHVESSFRALPNGFDHELWTGFELDGAHEAASCTVCHAPLRRPDEHGRTWGRAKGSNCGDCHADPHASQFDVAGVTDCARCHRSAKGFDFLRFNHDRHSRFPLGESHAGVACSSCHAGWELESGAEIVRYRPLDISCASCHGSQEGPTLRRRGRGN